MSMAKQAAFECCCLVLATSRCGPERGYWQPWWMARVLKESAADLMLREPLRCYRDSDNR